MFSHNVISVTDFRTTWGSSKISKFTFIFVGGLFGYENATIPTPAI
jgi:hypothetical protein